MHAGMGCFRRGYFKDTEAYWWVLSTTALEVEEVQQVRALPVLSEDPSVGLAEGRRTGAGHYHDVAPAAALHQLRLMIPIHKLMYQLESQAVISRTIWPV